MKAPQQLSARAIAAIVRGIPKGANTRRRALLAEMLRSWSEIELRDYAEYAGRHKGKPESKKLMDKIHRAALELDAHLQKALESGDIDYLGLMLKTRQDDKTISDLMKSVEVMRDASGRAAGSLEQGRGKPRNIIAHLVISDIAAIYELLYPKKATRAVHVDVDSDKYEETGPFWAFASGVWEKVFDSEDGLNAAVKSFTAKANANHRASPVVRNILSRL